MMRFLLTAALVLISFEAQAYIGPGAGLSALGALAAVAAAVVVALFGLVLFPIRMLVISLRRARHPDLQKVSRPGAEGAKTRP
jgi:uncharacterized membrane protein